MIRVPDSLLASKATSPELREALEAYGALRERDAEQVRAVAAAEHELEVAEARELEDAARVLREGGEMPPSGLDEQRVRLEEMRREAAALEMAVRDQTKVVEDAVNRNRPAWTKAHAGVTGRRREQLANALARFTAANEALRESLGADAFLSGDERRAVGSITLRGPNHEPYSFADLLSALEGYVAGTPAQETNRWAPGADQRPMAVA